MPKDHVWVICATARLAQYLKQKNAFAHTGPGARAAPSLNAVTLNQYLGWVEQEAALRGLPTGHTPGTTVLDAYQERVLWEQVIVHNLGPHAQALFDVSSLARSAMEAHRLALIWGVEPSSDCEENQRFGEWQLAFLKESNQRGKVDEARWQHGLTDALPELVPLLHGPRQVVFAGFTRYNPLEQRLRQILTMHRLLDPDWALGHPHAGASVLSHSYPDVAAEALAAALWAQERLTAQPPGNFALVVPDLAGHRHLLQDTLDDVLMPLAVRPGQGEIPRPFNISLGTSLASAPLVEAALQLLHLVVSAHRVEQTDVSRLLRNPFWSDMAAEASARALLEAELRQRVSPAAPLQRFVLAVERLSVRQGQPDPYLSAPRLRAHLQAALTCSQAPSHQIPPSHWARQLPGLLRELGWLSERKLSSHEFQAQQAFLECVDAVAHLDAVLGEVSLFEVARHVRRMCQERTFQPRTEGHPRLQVLGLLEASGLDFDGIWVMGMQDSAWPPPARPNPLLPAETQRQAGAPNASASIQLAFAQQLHAMLRAAAPEVVFSWSRMAGASELNPSPLIPPTPENHHFPAPTSPHWTVAAARLGSVQLEPPIEDHLAPPVSDAEHVQGGTWLLRAQAICPAWAYFQYRLGAAGLEEPVEGLDARKRGTFLHDSLEYFWTRVQTSDALRNMSASARSGLVAEAVAHVLATHDTDPRHEPLKPRLRTLEQERLQHLIEGWIEVELQRQHSYTVIDNEREVQVDLQGIRFRMMIDRIDRLEDGSLLVIDYKTGARIDTDNWASERLTEPQLPIYASIQPPAEGPVAGVVFAKVLMQDPTWAGLAQVGELLPKVVGLDSKAGRKLFPHEQFPDWAHVLQHWKRCIEGVAQEIQTGEAGVRFDRLTDLRYCDVKPLLRLDERQSQLQAWQTHPAAHHTAHGTQEYPA